MDYQEDSVTYLILILCNLLLPLNAAIPSSITGTIPSPEVINRKATVLIGSDVKLIGKSIQSPSDTSTAATTAWFRNDHEIGEKSYRRISILDQGFTLLITEFQHSDQAIYTFRYRTNTSYVITKFKTKGIEPDPPDSNNIAGTVIGLMLIFTVVFVVIFYCCRGGIGPTKASTMTRNELRAHRKLSETDKEGALNDLECRLARLHSGCFNCLDDTFDGKQQSYSNICTISSDNNESESKRNNTDVEIKINNNDDESEETSSIADNVHVEPLLNHESSRLGTDV